MVQESPSRELDKVIVRMPDGMRDRLKALAAENGRSLNAEIIQRLELSLMKDANDPVIEKVAEAAAEKTISSLAELFGEPCKGEDFSEMLMRKIKLYAAKRATPKPDE